MSSVITAGSMTADFSGVKDYKGKRAFDLFISFLLGLIFLPIILLTVFAIRLTSNGRVFFLQERYGRNRKKFLIYKFRTIDEKGNYLLLGKFLRKYAIDEMPQLLNVIKGEMSLVGPRPHMISHAEELEELNPKYKLRYAKNPGIAGVSQMYGYCPTKGVEAFNLMVNFDLQYIENSSLISDIVILYQTSKVFIKGH